MSPDEQAQPTVPLRDIDWVLQQFGGSVSRQRVYAWAREGLIPHTRIGRRLFFSPEVLADFFRRGGRPWPGGWKREPAEPRPAA